MVQAKEYTGLDNFRMAAAFLIVAIHTSPLTSVDVTADFILTRIIARVAVPFFFMVTGYFVLSGYLETDHKEPEPIYKYLLKIMKYYGISILIYLPVMFYSGYFKEDFTFLKLCKDILVNGMFYHLWYLPALLLGTLIVFLLIQHFSIQINLFICILLYLIGLFGDSYYGVIKGIPVIRSFYGVIFQFADYTRNGFFYAPVFLLFGAIIRKWQLKSLKIILSGFLVSLILLLTEGLLLHYLALQRHDSMYLFLLPCMYYLFQLLLKIEGKSRKVYRTLSLVIYIIHPLSIILLRGLAKVTGTQSVFIDNSMIHFTGVGLLSLGIALFYVSIVQFITKNHKAEKAYANK